MSASSSRRVSSRPITKSELLNKVIRGDLDSFLRDFKTRPEMINQLSEYLKYRPEWEQPRDLLPVDELEQRLDLAEKFQTWKRTKLAEKAKKADPDDDEAQKQAMGWKLNRLAYAACMTMPLSLLVQYTKTDDDDDIDFAFLNTALQKATEAVRSRE